ncbi:hypothetical protein ACFVWG_08930 [Kribbella sp. NPDC058245]|uniref:hypothetical protein n=1 Tax=Kribbella sp. NPDC058245 TaxID=3346399 RepID=UPI0036DFBC14
MSQNESLDLDRSAMPAFGYIHQHFALEASRLAALGRALVARASTYGCTLDGVFVEAIDIAPATLMHLVDTMTLTDNAVLIVPNLLHLSALGNPLDVQSDLQSQGIQILTAT